jgi:hypothetical protein
MVYECRKAIVLDKEVTLNHLQSSIIEALSRLDGSASRSEVRRTNIGALRTSSPSEVNEAIVSLVSLSIVAVTFVERKTMLELKETYHKNNYKSLQNGTMRQLKDALKAIIQPPC